MAERIPVIQRNMRKSVLLSLSVSSALLISAAYPPLNFGILAWIGLAPLLLALRQKGSFSASMLALQFGCLMGMGAFYWGNSITPINLADFLIMVMVFGLYFLPFGALYSWMSRHIGFWIIIGAPALWVSMEYTRSNLFFLSFPWNLLGHSQYRYLPAIQIADITGVYGISFFMVMVNQLLSQVSDFFSLRRGKSSHLAAANSWWLAQLLAVVLSLTTVLSYGWYRLDAPESNKRLSVALIQANVLTRDNMPYAEQKEHLEAYKRLTEEAAKRKPDLIIWPASSLPEPINASRLVRHTVRRLAREIGSYFLVGGSGYEKLKPQKDGYLPYSNSEFLISPSGQVKGQYNKIRLLPFNEYLPLKGKITWPRWITTIKESFLPGESYTIFQVSEARFGSPICWENLFPDLFRRFVEKGANFMVSATNEGFFGPTAAPNQTLAMNIFRAVENRVAVARSATTGVSAFINPNGEIVERIRDKNNKDLFVAGFLVRDIPLSNKKTFYTVHGDIFAYCVIGLTVFFIIITLWLEKLSRYTSRICDERH